MLRRIVLAVFVVAVLSINKVKAQTTVFSTDFNSGLPSAFSGAGSITSVQGFAGLGHSGNQFSGSFLLNTSTGSPAPASYLTLTGLQPHTRISVGFLLAAINTWDSINGSPSPDYFNVAVDGTTVFQTTFANSSGTINYSGDDIGNGQQYRGFSNSFGNHLSSAYDLYSEPALQNIAHSALTLTISWFASGSGWQGGSDESWAIDNVRVFLDGTTINIGGIIALQGTQNSVQPVEFTFRPTTGSTFTRTITLNFAGGYNIGGIPSGQYSVSIKGAKWLRKNITVDARAGNVTNANATLLAGDANNDNFADIADLLPLIAAYNKVSPNAGFSEAADFNCDGTNDIADLLLLIANYNRQGDS